MLVRGAEVRNLVDEVKTGLPEWKCSASNQKLTRELFSQKPDIQRAKAPNAAVHSQRTCAPNQFALLVVSKPYLKWISFGQSTSVPHAVTGVFSAFIGETIMLYSTASPQSILCSRCRATKAVFSKKNACFEVFYLLFFFNRGWLWYWLLSLCLICALLCATLITITCLCLQYCWKINNTHT